MIIFGKQIILWDNYGLIPSRISASCMDWFGSKTISSHQANTNLGNSRMHKVKRMDLYIHSVFWGTWIMRLFARLHSWGTWAVRKASGSALKHLHPTLHQRSTETHLGPKVGTAWCHVVSLYQLWAPARIALWCLDDAQVLLWRSLHEERAM